MSPKTKGRVKFTRFSLLALRVFALLGALASLFCGIVIKNARKDVIWIVRMAVSQSWNITKKKKKDEN